MLRTILVPLDGSPLAEQALPYAERLAQAAGADLVLVRVTPVAIMERAEEDLDRADEARGYLAQVANRSTARGVQVATVALWGDIGGSIVSQVQASDADLIVMSTHGRSGLGRWLYGSIADKVLHTAPVPVVLVPPVAAEHPATDHLSRILVPLDGSDLAEAVLTPVLELARTLGAEIVLLQVVAFPAYVTYDSGAALAAFDLDKEVAEAESYLAGVAARLEASGITARTRVELAKPALAIAEIGGTQHAGLIAMATHGRTGFSRLVLGSVATATLQHACVPLLLLGPVAIKPATAHQITVAPIHQAESVRAGRSPSSPVSQGRGG